MPPQNVFRGLCGEGGVFKDERALQPEFIPDVLPHRDVQIRELALALKPAAEGRKPENVVIVGPPGTGKTATARFVLKQLSEYSSKVAPLYVNCWEFSTRHAVLSQVCSLLGVFMPRRGIAADEIFARCAEVMRKEKKIAIVVLDEVDRLLAGRNDEEKVLYDLLRAGETHGVVFGVVGITNSEDFLCKLDNRIRSSLSQREVPFARYSPAQLKDILGERSKLAFIDGALSGDAIPLCAAHAAKNGGDARLGLLALWKAGKAAEADGASRVEAGHCKKAFSAAQALVREERLAGLCDVEKRIVAIAEEKGEVTSGELYSLLAAEFSETDRTIRNYIERLEALKLISAEERPRGKDQKGNTRIIRPLPPR